MNILRFGRGDFFGIIIPGAFLLLNLIFIIPIKENITIPNISDLNWVLYPLVVIICYILGDVLRLINPSIMDYFSSKINIFIRFIFKKRTGKKEVHFYNDKYPYITWFYDKYLNRLPQSSRSFWDDFLKTEYASDRKKLYDKNFINYCKSYITSESKELNNEILFSEGLVRFLSGMAIAFIIIIPLSILKNALPIPIVILYIICFIVILYRFRTIRVKEVVTTLNLFELLWIKSNKKKPNKSTHSNA
jgi:hypothetical protein